MKNKLTFSIFFTLCIGLANAVNIALNNFLFDILAMKTKSFFTEVELWRVLTYSFFTNSVEGFALFLFTFIFVAYKIEIFLGNRMYPKFLALITFLIGTVTTVSMVNENITFGGLEGTSFFIISIFLLLNKNKFIRGNHLYLNLSIILSIVLWLGIKYHTGLEYGFTNIVPSLIMALCGIIIGSLVFIQINYLIKKRIKTTKSKMANINSANIDVVKYAIYNNPKIKKYFYDGIESNHLLVKEKIVNTEDAFGTNSMTDEEKLDKILDKINDVGQSNLTEQEMEFLNYYSNKL